jgi:hypothetical protein
MESCSIVYVFYVFHVLRFIFSNQGHHFFSLFAFDQVVVMETGTRTLLEQCNQFLCVSFFSILCVLLMCPLCVVARAQSSADLDGHCDILSRPSLLFEQQVQQCS